MKPQFFEMKSKQKVNHKAFELKQKTSKPSWCILHFDGSCVNNGSTYARGKWGWVLLHPELRQPLAKKQGNVEDEVEHIVTCNVAEWLALEKGLKALRSFQLEGMDIKGIEIVGDSMLVIQCVQGLWKSKNSVLTIYRDSCLNLLTALNLQWTSVWVPREQNDIADELTR